MTPRCQPRPLTRHAARLWPGIGCLEAVLLGLLGCAQKPEIAPPHTAPRLVRVPAEAPEFPAQPPSAETGKQGCARAAFELPLDAAGHVRGTELRILAWEDDASDPYALVRLLARARASEWKVPAAAQKGGSQQEGDSLYALLRLDCAGVAADSPVPQWDAFETRLQESLRVRRLARVHLQQETGVHWSEHDLDCLWIRLGTWRRGPFMHDQVEGWEDLEPRLQFVQERDGGLWVCRAPRSSHMGQFVFVDQEQQVLAVARYWLGE